MKPPVPSLSPLLRSDTQGRMLAALFLHTDRELTLTELARESGVSAPTISRDIERLTAAGFVTQRPSGRNRYVRANTEHPIFTPVAEVLRYAYGPLALLPEIIAGLAGVERAFVYGSWAARYQGEVGADPNDIDVLLIGNLDRSAVYAAASLATSELNRETNFRAISRATWDRSDHLFVSTIRKGPLVEIPLGGSV